MVLVLVSVSVALWGRWHATRITKRLQSDVRRKPLSTPRGCRCTGCSR